MEPVIYRITLKMNGGTGPSLGMRQGDTGRRIYFSLAQDGKPYEIEPGCHAVFSGVKPDGTTLFNNCVIDGNTIIYDVTEQTTAVKGRVKCELKLYDVQEQLVTSPGFEIMVHGVVLPGDAVASSDEANELRELISESMEAIEECDEAVQRASDATQDAADAASYATVAGDDARQEAENAFGAAAAANASAAGADAARENAEAVAQQVQEKLDSGAFIGPRGEKGDKGDKGDPGWDTVEITYDLRDGSVAANSTFQEIHAVRNAGGFLRGALKVIDENGSETGFSRFTTDITFSDLGYAFTFDAYRIFTVNDADEWYVDSAPVESIGGVTYATMLGVGDLNAERNDAGDPPGVFSVYTGTRDDGVTDQVRLNSTHNFGNPVGLQGIAKGVEDTDAVNKGQMDKAVASRSPVYYTIANGAISIVSKYGSDKDLVVSMSRTGYNNIFDFTSLKEIANADHAPSNDLTSAASLLNITTDFHSPFRVSAVNNADGDNTTNTFTGGNHAHGGIPTGRTSEVRFFIDGKEVEQGAGYCSCVEIRWTNLIQGWNTIKNDGSCREVIQENHRMVFDGSEWNETVELIPLEDVQVTSWYGLQYFGQATIYPNTRFVGCTNRGLNAANSGDNKVTKVIGYGDKHRIEMEIDPSYDLGDRSMYAGVSGAYTASGKAYFYIINNQKLLGGNMYGLKGTYRFMLA